MTNGKIKESYTQYLKEYASREELSKVLGYPATDEVMAEKNERVDEAIAKMPSEKLYEMAWQWQKDYNLEDEIQREEVGLKFGDLVDLLWGNLHGRILVTDENDDDICICRDFELNEHHTDLFDKDVMAIGMDFDVDRAMHDNFAPMLDNDSCWSDNESELLDDFMLRVRVNVNRNDVAHDDESASVRYENDKDYDKAFYKAEVSLLHGLSTNIWGMECVDWKY